MRAIKTTTISILAIGLLVGSAVGVAAQDEPRPATVRGQMEWLANLDEVEGEVVDGLRQDTWASTGRLKMSDDRLTGDFREEGTMSRYGDGIGGAEVWRGTFRVENEGGVWEGQHSGCSSCFNAGGGPDESYVELVGSEGYEGLSTILFVAQRPWAGKPEPAWVNGVIFPGGVPEPTAE